MPNQPLHFSCNMSVFTPEERSAHTSALKILFGSVEAVEELEQGYAFRLPSAEPMRALVQDFIEGERRCCPFFGFVVRETPDGQSLWLDLRGPAGVKSFILAEVGVGLPPEIITALGIVHDR